MKSRFKRLKAQSGIGNDVNPNQFATDPNALDWQTIDANPVVNPNQPDPAYAIDYSGDPLKKKKLDKKVLPFTKNADGSINFTREEGTGVYKDNPYVAAFNVGASAVTGVANMIQNNKLKNKENAILTKSLEPAYMENMEGEGLNNLPMYTKYGGGQETGFMHDAFYGDIAINSGGGGKAAGGKVFKYTTGGGPSIAKAKEILTDGTVNGQPLTDRQKRYFGWIAGGKKGAGGCDDCDQMAAGGNWIPKDLKKGRCANPGDADCPEGSPQYNLAMTFKKHHGFHQAQTGGANPAPSPNDPAYAELQKKYNLRQTTPEQRRDWNMFSAYAKSKGYTKGSTELDTGNLGDQLFEDYRKENPNTTITRDLVPSVQAEMLQLRESAKGLAKRQGMPGAENVMNWASGIDNKIGDQTVYSTYPDAEYKEYNNGQLTSQQYLGLTDQNLTPEKRAQMSAQQQQQPGQPRFVSITGKPLPGGAKVEKGADGSFYYTNKDGDFIQVQQQKKAGGSKKKYISGYQAGGNPEEVPEIHGLPDEYDDQADVEAEAGEVIKQDNGRIVKVANNAKTHEQGGEMIPNVQRVLEDTSNKRKDKASKALLVDPKEIEQVLGFKPKSATSHAKVFEQAKKELGKTNKLYDNANKTANMLPEMTKTTLNSLKLNAMFQQQLPDEQEIFDLLYNHQEGVKAEAGINDDGSMKKYGGGKYKAQAGKGVSRLSRNFTPAQRAEYVYNETDGLFYKKDQVPDNTVAPTDEAPNTNIVGNGIKRLGRSMSAAQRAEYVYDEGTQLFYKKGQAPNPQTASTDPDITYKGGKTPGGSVTPMGNSNAFNYPGGFDAFKKSWSPYVDLSQYNNIADAQAATYEYLVKNQPDVAASIWETEGLTNKGKELIKKDPAFAKVAKEVFNADGTLKPGTKLTPEQLAVLSPAYADNMLGRRAVAPSTETTTTHGTGVTQKQKATLDASVNTNRRIVQQPANKFHEPTYWSDVAGPTAALVDAFRRDPELYNPQEFHQLRYKLLDPTAALVANQADYNAAVAGTDEEFSGGSGVGNANKANMLGQKYKANAQILGQYAGQNSVTKNREIDYNTNARDKQSAADAGSRATFYRNVQLGREAQREQILTSVGQLARVDQLKRRQNSSGNLALKLSPAYNQYGEYNGFQYVPYVDPSTVNYNEFSRPATPTPKSTTTTTETFRNPSGKVTKKVTTQ